MLKRLLIALSATVLFGTCLSLSRAQDSSQSLGDAARQARLKKQQQQDAAANDSQAKAADGDVVPVKAARVITNDEIPSHIGPASRPNSQRSVEYGPPASGAAGAAEAMKQQFLAAKSRIASMESEIARASQSIRFAGGNCVANCVQHNEREMQKQQQIESMKAQLEEQKRQLEQQQEAARRQGYGSSVYDP